MTNTRHSEASPELDPRVLEALQSFGAHYEVITHAQFYQPIMSPQDFAQAANCNIRLMMLGMVFRRKVRRRYCRTLLKKVSQNHFDMSG